MQPRFSGVRFSPRPLCDQSVGGCALACQVRGPGSTPGDRSPHPRCSWPHADLVCRKTGSESRWVLSRAADRAVMWLPSKQFQARSTLAPRSQKTIVGIRVPMIEKAPRRSESPAIAWQGAAPARRGAEHVPTKRRWRRTRPVPGRSQFDSARGLCRVEERNLGRLITFRPCVRIAPLLRHSILETRRDL